MNNSRYWQKRFELLNEKLLKKADDLIPEINAAYDTAIDNISKEIESFYLKFAGDNGLSIADAKKLLTRSERKAFRMTIEDYIKIASQGNPKSDWVKILKNASTVSRIDRLEALEIQMRQQVEMLEFYKDQEITKTLSEIYEEGYYRTGYELQKGLAKWSSFERLDVAQIRKVIISPWSPDGTNFSEKIWGTDRRNLILQLNTKFTQAIIRGEAPKKVIGELAKTLNTSKANAGRLILTESAAFASAARQDGYNRLGIEQYEIVATLDEHTCTICGAAEGKPIPKSEYEVGVTAPPFHPWCRCTTVPYFDDKFTTGEQRAARAENGKTEYVDDMTYNKWKDQYISSPDTTDYYYPYMNKIRGYNFSDGTNAKRTNHVGNADCYIDENGVEFIYKENYSRDRQLIDPERAIRIFNELPERLKSEIDTIEFLDYENPQDVYWREKYNMPNGFSFATGSRGHITFWRNDIESNKALSDEYVLGVYAHEIAHSLDKTMAPGGFSSISESTVWKDMVERYYIHSGQKVATEYGKVSVKEDFADSFKEYIVNHKMFVEKFPNRAEYIARIIK